MSTPKSPFEQPLDEKLSRSLKEWVEAVDIPLDLRDELLQCAADEACREETLAPSSLLHFLWELFSFRDNDNVIAPSMPKDMKTAYSRGDEFTFGLSVYALQNAISAGACRVRTS